MKNYKLIAVIVLSTFILIEAISAVIVLACILFGSFVSSEPMMSEGATVSKMLWEYILQVTFNLFVLTASVKMANVMVKTMLGL